MKAADSHLPPTSRSRSAPGCSTTLVWPFNSSAAAALSSAVAALHFTLSICQAAVLICWLPWLWSFTTADNSSIAVATLVAVTMFFLKASWVATVSWYPCPLRWRHSRSARRSPLPLRRNAGPSCAFHRPRRQSPCRLPATKERKPGNQARWPDKTLAHGLGSCSPIHLNPDGEAEFPTSELWAFSVVDPL